MNKPRPGPTQHVYSLEVNGEHVDYVGHQQLLVHSNGCNVMGYRVEAEDDRLAGNTRFMFGDDGESLLRGDHSGKGIKNHVNFLVDEAEAQSFLARDVRKGKIRTS